MQKLLFNIEAIKQTFDVFQGGLHELRVIPYKGITQTLAGYFDNVEDIINQIHDKNLESVPFFMTLNEIDSNAECIGKLNVLRKSSKTISDKDVLTFKKVHIDIDTEKSDPHGQATDEEVKYAEAKMHEVYDTLKNFGFPEGIISFSGNGYNIDFYVNIPNTTDNKSIIKAFLKLLSQIFSDEHVKIDTTTYNPGRVIKYYGCVSGKGENTDERPYRLTKIISVPDVKQELTLEKIRSFISAHSTKDSGKVQPKFKVKSAANGDKKLVAKISDVDGWLNYYNVTYSKKDSEYNGEPCIMHILEDCPFNEHDNKNCSFIIKYKNGNCFYKCHHNHCQEFTIHDMLAKYPLINQIPLIQDDSKATQVYNKVVSNCKLIMAEDNQHYILTDKNEVVHLDSSEAGDYIVSQAQKIDILPSKAMITNVKLNLNATYEKYANHAIVAERIAYKDDTIYYTLNRNNSVKISIHGIEMGNIPCDNIYFYYDKTFSPQCEPDFNTPATALPELVKQTFNISEEYMLSFLAQLVCFYMPHINTPLLVLSGGQGTSKSTTSRKIKSLVDPTAEDIQSLPAKLDFLYTALSGNYLVAFDNIDKISNEYSSVFCIACTGGVVPKRKLYSDNDKVSIKLHNKIILNGIGDIISKNDLAERTNIIYLDTIVKRRTEVQVWKEFNKLKSQILGAIFNCIKEGLGYV